MKRLIIVGSPRANGRSAHLAEMLFETNIAEHPEEREKGMPSVCEAVVNETAPEYYICHNTAKQIILRERKRSKEEAMRWVKR